MIDGKWAIVTEYVEGETLAEKMEKDPENFDKYLEYLRKVLKFYAKIMVTRKF